MQKVQLQQPRPSQVAAQAKPVIEKPTYSQVLKAAERMIAARTQKQNDVQVKQTYVEAAESQIAQLENCLASLSKTHGKLDAIGTTDTERTAKLQDSRIALDKDLAKIREFSSGLDRKLAEHGAMCAKYDDRDKDYLKLVDAMKKRVASLTNCVHSKQLAVQECKTAQEKLDKQLQDLYAELQGAANEKATLAQDRDAVKENICNLEIQVAAWKKEDDALDTALLVLMSQVNETVAKNKQLNEVKEQAAKDIASLEKDIAYVMDIETKATSLKYDKSFVANILQYTELMQAYHISDVQMVKDQCISIVKLKELIDSKSAFIATTQLELDSLWREVHGKNSSIQQLTKEVTSANALKLKIVEETKAKREHVDKLHSDEITLQQKIKSVQENIKLLKQEATKQQQAFVNAQKELEGRNSNAMSRSDVLTRQIATTQNNIGYARQEYMVLEQSKKDFEKKAKHAQLGLESHNNEYERLFTTEQQVNGELAKHKEMMNDCAAEIKMLTEKQEALDAQWKKILDKREVLKEQHDKAKSKLDLDNEARKANLLQQKEALYAKQQLEMRQFEAQLRQESQSMVGDLFVEQAGIDDLFLEK